MLKPHSTKSPYKYKLPVRVADKRAIDRLAEPFDKSFVYEGLRFWKRVTTTESIGRGPLYTKYQSRRIDAGFTSGTAMRGNLQVSLYPLFRVWYRNLSL